MKFEIPETIRNIDLKSLEDALFWAFILYLPIVVFQRLLNFPIQDRTLLTVSYVWVVLRRLGKAADQEFVERRIHDS